jgi:hypothetical protein
MQGKVQIRLEGIEITTETVLRLRKTCAALGRTGIVSFFRAEERDSGPDRGRVRLKHAFPRRFQAAISCSLLDI